MIKISSLTKKQNKQTNKQKTAKSLILFCYFQGWGGTVKGCVRVAREAGIAREMGGNRAEIGKNSTRIFCQRGSKSCHAGNVFIPTH